MSNDFFHFETGTDGGFMWIRAYSIRSIQPRIDKTTDPWTVANDSCLLGVDHVVEFPGINWVIVRGENCEQVIERLSNGIYRKMTTENPPPKFTRP